MISILAYLIDELSERIVWQWRIRARTFNHSLFEHVVKPGLPLGRQHDWISGAGNCWLSYRLHWPDSGRARGFAHQCS